MVRARLETKSTCRDLGSGYGRERKREDIRISNAFLRKLVLRREENLDVSGHRLLHRRGLLWGKMSSWDPQGGIKDDELVPGGGIRVGKCSLFLLLACRA